MIWSRRSFLKFSIGAAGLVLTTSVDALAEYVAGDFPFSVIVHSLKAQTIGAGVAEVRIARKGPGGAAPQPLVVYPIGGGGMMTWVAPLEQGLVWGHGLENQSDDDVEILYLEFSYNKHTYVWANGHIIALDKGAPLLPENFSSVLTRF